MVKEKINNKDLEKLVNEMFVQRLQQLKEDNQKAQTNTNEDRLQKYLNENVVGWAKAVMNENKNNSKIKSVVSEAIEEYINEKIEENKKIEEFRQKFVSNIDNMVDEIFEQIKKKK